MGITRDDDRPKGDFYETPPEAVYALMAAEEFVGDIWECACGTGRIVKALQHLGGHKIIASDLYEYETDIKAEWGINFLDPDNLGMAKNIITNPPFSELYEFALMAEQHMFITGGKVAFLARLAWLESIKRMDFFKEGHLKKVWVFSRRLPRMHRPGYSGKKFTSMVAFAWFIWEASYEGEPTIGWLDWRDHVR